MSDAPPKSKLEVTAELVKALAWPVFALILLLSLWSPLRTTAELIPSIVGRSDTITIAGLSLKIGQGLKSKASPAVEAVLAKLSKEGIKRVLAMSQGSYWDQDQADYGHKDNSELVKLGLLAELSKDELADINNRDHKDYGYGIKPTELGRQTQTFLQSVVAEFVQEVGRQSPIDSSSE